MAARPLRIQEWFPYHEERYYQLVKEALESKAVEVPDEPGIGVELKDQVIGRYPCLRIS